MLIKPVKLAGDYGKWRESVRKQTTEILFFFCSFLIVAGCAGITEPGLIAVSPDSPSAMIFERKGSPATWNIALLELKQDGTAVDIEKNINPPVGGRFAAGKEYVLIASNRTAGTVSYDPVWRVTDFLGQSSIIRLDSPSALVELLPNGDLLLGNGPANKLDQLWQAKADDPENRKLLISDILAIFFSEDKSCQKSGGVPCRIWTTIGKDGTIIAFIADEETVKSSKITSSIATKLVRMLVAQKALTDSGMATVLSPGGRDLLIRTDNRTGNTSTFTLQILHLESGVERILSDNTDWKPSFRFSPDGSQILYNRASGPNRSVIMENIDGTDSLEILEYGPDEMISFSWD